MADSKSKISTLLDQPLWLLHLAGFLFFAAALCINPLKITRSFFSDEAVYYTMAYSFVDDHDMEFQREDLIRTYHEFAAGPTGIILKVNERDNTIVFGKAYLYSLVAAPFVAVFGTNGFLVLHALLLWLNLLCGYRFCSAFMQKKWAVLFSLFYFLASAALLYVFWMTPEFFDMSLVCYAIFFFVADSQIKSKSILLNKPSSYILSAIFFAMATFSKPTNILLLAPFGIWLLATKQIKTALIVAGVFVIAVMALFGLNVYFTGDWNYQGGQRAVFYDHYPYERPGVSPFAAFNRRRPIISMVLPPFYVKAFAANWVYFFFGRFSGLAIYFFPMFFGVIYFIVSKKTGLSKAAYVAGWIGILTYMVGIPWNYFGGSGTIGNRYLMNAFPVFLFVLQEQPSRKWFFSGFCASLLFASAFLFTPVLSSFDNSFHQKRSLFGSLPSEMTLLSDLPINTNLRGRRVSFDQPPTYFLYFMDDDTYYRENFDHQIGFWVKGERTAEITLRTFEPVSRLKISAKSLARNNSVWIRVGDKKSQILLRDPVFYLGELKLPTGFPYDRDHRGATYLYHLDIHSELGQISTIGDQGERDLGVFVKLELPEVKAKEIPEEEPED
jgi:hypothetical protein